MLRELLTKTHTKDEFKDIFNIKKVIAIVNIDSKPILWLIRQAKREKRIYNGYTKREKMRSIVVVDSGDIIISPLTSTSLLKKIKGSGKIA